MLFAEPNCPLAQPRSVLVSNTVSTLIERALAATMPMGPWVGPLAVALAIAVMMLARALHPPGGAVAFLVAMGMPRGWTGALAEVADHFRKPSFTSVQVNGADGAVLGVNYPLDLFRKARKDAFRSRKGLIMGNARMIDVYRPSPLTTKYVMLTGVPCAGAETPVGALQRLLSDGRTPAVPVVDGERLVGVVTWTKLVSALAQWLTMG